VYDHVRHDVGQYDIVPAAQTLRSPASASTSPAQTVKRSLPSPFSAAFDTATFGALGSMSQPVQEAHPSTSAPIPRMPLPQPPDPAPVSRVRPDSPARTDTCAWWHGCRCRI
jgi:hypothetical protein